MKSEVFTREALYNLIWSKPMITLAKEYAYSDNGLRKICKKHNIPLPNSGYWSKLKFNKEVSKTTLPKTIEKEVSIELFIRTEGVTSLHPNSERIKIKREIESSQMLNLIVPERLSNPDPLIIEAKNNIKDKKPSLLGNSEGLINTSKGILNIAVSKPNIPRALKFVDTLIKLIKDRGHSIKITDATYVVINDESIKIRFREVLKRIIIREKNWDRSELVPSGILSFRLNSGYSEKEWRDSEKVPIESRLSIILTTLELRAKQRKEDRIESEIQRKKWEEEYQQKQEQKLLKEKELSNSKQLFDTASRWHKSQYLRNYIKEVQTMAVKMNSLTEEKQEWIIWANNKADWLDPLLSIEDEILGTYENSMLKKAKY